MKFIKEYWWVFAFILAAILLYWFMFRKEAAVQPSGFVCNNTKAQWTTKLNQKIAYMKTDAGWQQEAQDKVADGTHVSLDEAYAGMADWSLRVSDKQCNPNYPLNYKDQFGA